MEIIGKNEELLEYLTGNNSLLSSKLTRIDINTNVYQLAIAIYIDLLYSNKKLKIQFENILEYSFFYTSDYSFYYIESYKFFMSEKGFYISLDPFDELKEVSLQDQDYILCKNVQGYFIEE